MSKGVLNGGGGGVFRGVPRIWEGGGQEFFFFSILEFAYVAKRHAGADWTCRPTALRAVGPWLNYAIFYELIVICCERYLIFPLKRAIICHLEP